MSGRTYQWRVKFDNGTETTVVSGSPINRDEAIRRAKAAIKGEVISAVQVVDRK